MHAMQMTIRARQGDAGVAARLADAVGCRPARGLVHASCLYDEAQSLFAPFFVWRSGRALRGFLLGNRFREVSEGVDRPRVRTWTVLRFDFGAADAPPTYAVREIDALGENADLAHVARREGEHHREMLAFAGLYAHAVLLDPCRWEVGRLSLWRDRASAAAPQADCVETYSVSQVYEPAGAHGC